MQVYKYRSALPKDKLSKSSPLKTFFSEDFLLPKTFSLSKDYLFSEDCPLIRRLSPSEDCLLQKTFSLSEDYLLI